MSYDDFDSDNAATGERQFSKSKTQTNYRSSASNQKTSILKNSSLRRSTQYSDEEDENFNNSGRLSNRNRYGNDSPLNSYRSDSNAGKPPSGRLQPIIVGKTNDYSSKKSLPAITYKNNPNDSDDAYTDTRFTKKTGLSNENKYDKYDKYDKPETSYDRFDKKVESSSSLSKYDRFDYKNDSNYETKNSDSKYDRFEKKSSFDNNNNKYERFDIPLIPAKKSSKLYDTDSKYDDSNNNTNSIIKSNSLTKFDKFDSKYDSKYDSKFESKYDTYDEDEINNRKNDMSNKYFRSEGPLKSSSKTSPLDSLDLYSRGPVTKNQRSNSLDRIHSGYNQILASNTLTSTGSGGRMSKFNSTSNLNGIDNSSDRSYTVTSMTSNTLSIKEAKSRSYLVGSLSAINGKGLLSSEELERNLADKRARILVATWNLGGAKKLSDNLDELLLPDTIQTMPDIYVIGVEEFELNQKEWEITLQEQIGPAHVKFTSYYHGSVGLCIFIKRELIWFCSIAEYEHINLRAGPINTPNATKASVLISFQLFGTLMCFICSHFSSGEGNIENRIENYKTTINSIKLPNKLLTKNRLLATDGTDNFDCVFWLGDFNFRVDKERGKVVDKISDMRKKKSINYEDIMNHDELNRVIDEDKAFKNFLEGRITFEPTYKYELNSDEYDRSEKCRIPSYTDRILFRSRQKGIISCAFYDAVKEIKVSDHRPVYGVYEVNIRPGVDTIPLSYGEFDRQVYAAGYQKRQMFRACDVGFNTKTVKSTKKSSPCSIQ